MVMEIRRIQLVSAGIVIGTLIASLTLVFGLMGFVAAAASGDLALIAEWAGEAEDLNAAETAENAGVLSGILALFLLGASVTAALIGGFCLGVFFAALHNVVAGVTGGLRLEVADPTPRDPAP